MRMSSITDFPGIGAHQLRHLGVWRVPARRVVVDLAVRDFGVGRDDLVDLGEDRRRVEPVRQTDIHFEVAVRREHVDLKPAMHDARVDGDAARDFGCTRALGPVDSRGRLVESCSEIARLGRRDILEDLGAPMIFAAIAVALLLAWV
jgi:hypothetical protein